MLWEGTHWENPGWLLDDSSCRLIVAQFWLTLPCDLLSKGTSRAGVSEAEARLPLKSTLESHLKLFHIHLSVKKAPFVLDNHTAEIELKRSDSYLDLFTAVPLRKCQNCHLVPQPFTQSRDKKQHHHGAGLMCLSKMTINSTHQMDRSLNPLNLFHVTIWLRDRDKT